MRINKFIAKTGYTSRRKAEDLIREGRIKVNEKVIEEFSFDVSENDNVTIDGKKIQIEEKFYIKLNKPKGYISSNYDPHNPKDLNELLKIDKRFFCAGRLDKDSHGLMIITNDGDVANALIHPKYNIDKKYIVKVSKLLRKDEIKDFVCGIDIGNNEITSNSKLELIDKNNKIYEVIIHQGYNRQIRRMFEYFKSDVIDLKRIKIGEIELENLKDGFYNYLNNEEINYLMSLK